jgi:hypothetical protein
VAITLDRLENLVLSDEQQSRFLNEVQRLKQLNQGLNFLYKFVRDVEQGYQSKPGMRVFSFGNIPGYVETPRELILCAFHWYSVSLSNFCRLIGRLGHVIKAQGFEDKGHSYYKKVCGPVKVYRDKVAAHFAFSYPSEFDNRADLSLSTMDDLVLVDGRFTVGVWLLTKSGSSGTIRSSHDYQWSLTSYHEELGRRYGSEGYMPSA